MRRWSAAAVAAALLLAGCDEEKQSPKGSAQTAPPATQAEARADAPAVADPASAVELPPAAAQAKSAAAPDQRPADPGRVTFDGDRKRDDAVTVPPAVFAGTPSSTQKPLSTYNRAARADSLSVTEPPSPQAGSAQGDLRAAAPAKRRTAATATGDSDAALPKSFSAQSSAVPDSSGSCPEGMARVEGYCIDKYEGSLLVSRDGADKMWPPNYKLEDGLVYKAVSRAAAKPQGYISGDQAAAACAQAGKRLCSMKEWVKACQGPMKTQYPYGAAYEAGACNEFDHKDHSGHRSAMHRLYGDNASFDYKTMNDPRLDAMTETVAPSGSFSKCTNGYGVYDMVGNVHEWVADKAGGRGVFKGGYFEDTHLNGDGCRYTTTAHETSYHDYSTGFRCCADPS